MNRREFMHSASRHAAAAAIPVAGAAAGASELYTRLSDQMGRTAEVLGAGMRELSASLGSLAGRVDSLELRYRLVMALLVISMLLDGGMTWMLLNTPIPVVA